MLGIITELERMGDYAEGIAKITLMIGHERQPEPPVEIHQGAEMAGRMLQESLESLQFSNAEKAKNISGEDDQVDQLYDRAVRLLILYMIEHPQDITRVTWLVWVAHNLERFADRVTNICERIVFSINGELKDVNVSKY